MQIAQVCSRWWAFKVAKRCGRVVLCPLIQKLDILIIKTECSLLLYLISETWRCCVLGDRQGKERPELQPWGIPPGIRLCLFLVYGKKWDQRWTNVFSLLKSFWSPFLMQGIQACSLTLPKLSEGCWFSVPSTPLHSVISIPDHARCFPCFLCQYT